MSGLQEIEFAIGKLYPQELEDLQTWMEERYTQPIDTQLRADLKAGRMDSRIRQALAEHSSGNTRT
jgi:hypothetical protein